MKERSIGRNYIISVIIFTFICFIFPISGLADPANGNLMGFVYDKDGKTPLKEARILLKKVKSKKGDKIYKSDPTSETGAYKMTNIPEGKYKAAIEVKNGKMYHTLAVVIIIGGKTVIRSFHLAPKRPFIAFFIEPCGLAMTIIGAIVTIELFKEEASPTELK